MTDVLEASLTVTKVDVVDSAGPLLAVIGDGKHNWGGRGGGGALKSMSSIALGTVVVWTRFGVDTHCSRLAVQ